MSVQGLLVDAKAGLLWACTGNLGVSRTPVKPTALLAFTLSSGAPRGRWELPGGGYCNDLVQDAAGRLYVTDTPNPRVLRFDPKTSRFEQWARHPLLGGAPHNANGVALSRDGRALYLVTFADGRLLRVPILENGRSGVPEVLALPRPLVGADALRALGDGSLVVFENGLPSGGGRVTRITVEGSRATLETVVESSAEPTSGIVVDGRLLYVESQFARLFGARKGQAPEPFRISTVALRPERLSLPPGFTYPNGITHAEDGTLFVGSVSSGRILRRAPGGDWTELFPGSEEVFAVTSLRLDAPRGLLWGTSPDVMGLLRPGGTLGKRAPRLFAVDARTGEVRRIVPIPEGGMGNDLTVAPDGGLYVTDSNRGSVLHLRPGGKQLETYVADARLQAKGTGMAGVGPAGIALAPDGRTLAVNTYGPGRLFLVRTGTEGAPPTVSEVELPRRLENPDGMRFARDGRLLVLEGAASSGNGRVARIDVLGAASGPRPIEVLASGMESPVNLTVTTDGRVWVTEARLRERLLHGAAAKVPDAFWVTVMPGGK
jgi:sugar lactone lactonase YvrE